MAEENTALEEPEVEEEQQRDNEILGPRLNEAMRREAEKEKDDAEGSGSGEEEGDGESPHDSEEEPGEEDRDGEQGERSLEPVDVGDDTPIEITVNKQKRVVTLGQLKADAQKVQAATERFQAAAEKEKEVGTREAKIRNAETYFSQVIKAVTEDPLATMYNILAKELGDEAEAYERVVRVATKFVGEHMEFLQLPEEEKQKRKTETILSRKEREIERLRREKAERDGRDRLNTIVIELKQKAEAAGITDHEDLVEIGGIFDRYQGARSIDECIQEYQESVPQRRKKLLESLSDDELKELNLTRAGKASKAPLGTVKRKPPASTSQAKRKEREEAPPKHFRNFHEAWLDAQKHKKR